MQLVALASGKTDMNQLLLEEHKLKFSNLSKTSVHDFIKSIYGITQIPIVMAQRLQYKYKGHVYKPDNFLETLVDGFRV